MPYNINHKVTLGQLETVVRAINAKIESFGIYVDEDSDICQKDDEEEE